MKKKSLICLAMTMVLVLGGCGSSAGKAPASSQTTGTEIPNSKATTTQSLVTETAASEDNPVSTGGIPWMCGMLSPAASAPSIYFISGR